MISWAMPRYEYRTVNTSHHGSVADSANSWAREGWRVVGVIPPEGPGYAIALVIERPIEPTVLPPIITEDPGPLKTERGWPWNKWSRRKNR